MIGLIVTIRCANLCRIEMSVEKRCKNADFGNLVRHSIVPVVSDLVENLSHRELVLSL